MLRTLAFVLLLSIFSSRCMSNYEGYQVIRFFPRDDAEVQTLISLGDEVDFWKAPSIPGQHADVMFSPEQHGLQTSLSGYIANEVYVDDVVHLVEAATRDAELPISTRDFNTSRFYTRDELLQYLDDEAAVCGPDCSVVTIGASYEGIGLKVIRISRPGRDRFSVWLDGGVHAREWLAPAVASYFVDRLINDYGVDPEVTQLRDSYDWYIMNLVNPDGYEYTWTTDRLWRKTRSPNANTTCDGTDGNRNYDFAWDQGDTDPCSQTYHGPSPESESEIASLTSYMETFAPSCQLSISFHCYSQIILRPWGFTEEDPLDVVDLENLATVGVNAINANSDVTYTQGRPNGVLAGSSMDWAKAAAGIKYSYTIELRDNGTYGFIAPPEEILPTCVEAFAGVSAMALDLLP